VLEIASGTGQHVAYFAGALTRLEWQPSDPDPDMRASIAAWIAEQGLTNLRSPVALDAREADWPVGRVDAVLCINMVHISPWSATLGLLTGDRPEADRSRRSGPLRTVSAVRSHDPQQRGF
jgi:hypothetical protein